MNSLVWRSKRQTVIFKLFSLNLMNVEWLFIKGNVQVLTGTNIDSKLDE